MSISPYHRRRFLNAVSFMLLGTRSIAEAAACESITDYGGMELSLDQDTKVSVLGFDASVKYVTETEGAGSRTLKIKSASEEPHVDVSDGKLTIHPTNNCGDSDPSETMESSGSPVFMSIVSSLVSTGLVSGLIFMPPSSGLSATLLLSLALGTSKFAYGQQVDDECTPSIEIEISVPYDCPYNNFVNGQCLTPEQIADSLVQALFVEFDVDATAALLATDYIQHNPTVPTGAAPVLGFIPALEESGLAIEVHRTIAQGNLVAYHSTYTNATLFGGDTLVGFDVFRVEDGKVQEHWDNLQALVGPTPSGNTMVDGPTMVKYLSETDENTELAKGLVEAVLIGGNASAAPSFISNETYTQHNPQIADGLEGLQEAFANLAAADMLFKYDSIELVVAQGNFVLLGSVGEFGANNPTAFYDMFRAEGGQLVEHWDVLQSIPAESEFAHTNGKF